MAHDLSQLLRNVLLVLEPVALEREEQTAMPTAE